MSDARLQPIQVLIVEDHRMVAEGLAVLLNAEPDIRVQATAASMAEAIRLAEGGRPDVILMDFRLPDGSGADAAVAIRKQRPRIPVLFLSGEDSEQTLLAAVQAGGCGFLPKSRAASEVAAAVRRAADGEMLIPADRLATLLARVQERARQEAERVRLLGELTPREKEILGLMAQGLDNRAIADHLVISFTTVRGHVQNILEKLDAHSKLEAVALAARHGLVAGPGQSPA